MNRRQAKVAAALLALLLGGTAVWRRVRGPSLPEPAAAPAGDLERRGPYTVTRVMDGDTIKLDDGETIRLIGVDAPEIHHPELPVQRFGQEASDFMKRLLDGFQVTLEVEPSEPKDKYGRTLAYVWKGDLLANAEIIRRGYAYAYTRFDFRRRDEFLALEREARRAQYGLWHLSLRDGRIANLLTRYDRLSQEGRKRFDEDLDSLILQYPADEGPVSPSRPPPKPVALPDGVIPWRDAEASVGKRVTVEGRIAVARNTGKACFLNFHPDYKRYLSLVILGSGLKRFPGDPAKTYQGKTVRATGTVERRDGRLEIVLEQPSQVQVVE